MAEPFKFNFGEFIHKHFTAIIALAIFLVWWTGGSRSGQSHSTHDTTTYTTQVPQPIVIMPSYQPQQAGNTIYPITIPQQYNPSQDIAKLTDQYTTLLKNFLAEKTYRDSITLRDTAGRNVGVVKLSQLVSENTLKSTQPTYQLSFPHTYTTITNTIYPPIRNQIFFGASIQSPIQSPSVGQIDLGLIFKNKKENIISLSGTYDLTTRQPGIRVGYFQKIRLKSLTPKVPLPVITSRTE